MAKEFNENYDRRYLEIASSYAAGRAVLSLLNTIFGSTCYALFEKRKISFLSVETTKTCENEKS
jgi:hypothetical protein